MKKPYLLILLVMLSACSDSGDDQNREIDLVVLEDLIEHTKEFEKRVYSYESGLHIAVGYGIANSIMVEGVDGNIMARSRSVNCNK